jgi:hypothetical protein
MQGYHYSKPVFPEEIPESIMTINPVCVEKKEEKHPKSQLVKLFLYGCMLYGSRANELANPSFSHHEC